jgi:putative SOS response-associated peptidase YedK
LQHPYEPCQTFLDRLRAFFAALLERKADLQHQSLMMRLTFKQNDQSKNAHERDRRMLMSSHTEAFKWWKGKHGACSGSVVVPQLVAVLHSVATGAAAQQHGRGTDSTKCEFERTENVFG